MIQIIWLYHPVQVKISGITLAWWYYRIHYIYIAMTFMLEWHGQYWIPSDNIDFMARMRYTCVIHERLSVKYSFSTYVRME